MYQVENTTNRINVMSMSEFFNFGNDAKTLYIGDRVGATQYIDFLSWEEVEEPVMKGYDVYGRKFFVIKMLVLNQRIMQTFFMRYSDGIGWMGCGHATKNLIDTSGCMSDIQIQLIQDIINNKKVTIKEAHRPCDSCFVGKKVTLFDEKRWNAAIVIQRAWTKCRYDPQYEMCARVQSRNMELIMINS